MSLRVFVCLFVCLCVSIQKSTRNNEKDWETKSAYDEWKKEAKEKKNEQHTTAQQHNSNSSSTFVSYTARFYNRVNCVCLWADDFFFHHFWYVFRVSVCIVIEGQWIKNIQRNEEKKLLHTESLKRQHIQHTLASGTTYDCRLPTDLRLNVVDDDDDVLSAYLLLVYFSYAHSYFVSIVCIIFTHIGIQTHSHTHAQCTTLRECERLIDTNMQRMYEFNSDKWEKQITTITWTKNCVFFLLKIRR